MSPNARLARCMLPRLICTQSNEFCVLSQVAENLAKTFLHPLPPESARPSDRIHPGGRAYALKVAEGRPAVTAKNVNTE